MRETDGLHTQSDTLYRIPATPPAYHRQELPFPFSEGDHTSHWTPHPRSTGECLIPNGCLNLVDIG